MFRALRLSVCLYSGCCCRCFFFILKKRNVQNIKCYIILFYFIRCSDVRICQHAIVRMHSIPFNVIINNMLFFPLLFDFSTQQFCWIYFLYVHSTHWIHSIVYIPTQKTYEQKKKTRYERQKCIDLFISYQK